MQKKMKLMVVLLVLASVCNRSLAQLGEAAVEDTETEEESSEGEQTVETEETDIQREEEEEEEKEEEGGGGGGDVEEDYYDDEEVVSINVGFKEPRYWKLEETYKGCIHKDGLLNGSFFFVDLTDMVQMSSELQSELGACYQLCRNKDSFSNYISVRLDAGEGADACGCHDAEELEVNQKVDDGWCVSDGDYRRVYCGPANVDCFSVAASLGSYPLSLLFLSLLGHLYALGCSR